MNTTNQYIKEDDIFEENDNFLRRNRHAQINRRALRLQRNRRRMQRRQLRKNRRAYKYGRRNPPMIIRRPPRMGSPISVRKYPRKIRKRKPALPITHWKKQKPKKIPIEQLMRRSSLKKVSTSLKTSNSKALKIDTEKKKQQLAKEAHDKKMKLYKYIGIGVGVATVLGIVIYIGTSNNNSNYNYGKIS